MTAFAGKRRRALRLLRGEASHWQLYLLALPAIVYILVFCYKPMYGIIIAFKDFTFRGGVAGSKWVGLKHFNRLFSSYWFPIILKNTLSISILSILITFPVPIILALMVNEVSGARLRKVFQTVSYAPHFISTVVMCGMVILFLKPSSGLINNALAAMGYERQYFMQNPAYFKWIYVLSDVWQNTGWNAIIYFAALSAIDRSQVEAAQVDGASRLQIIRHVNLPVLVPTVMVMLILKCGQVMNVGYEKVYLLQNDANLTGSEVISTFVYKMGLQSNEYSFSTAAGLMNSVVNAIVLLLANTLSRRLTQSSLW